jgi:hypothetical protein
MQHFTWKWNTRSLDRLIIFQAKRSSTELKFGWINTVHQDFIAQILSDHTPQHNFLTKEAIFAPNSLRAAILEGTWGRVLLGLPSYR